MTICSKLLHKFTGSPQIILKTFSDSSLIQYLTTVPPTSLFEAFPNLPSPPDQLPFHFNFRKEQFSK